MSLLAFNIGARQSRGAQNVAIYGSDFATRFLLFCAGSTLAVGLHAATTHAMPPNPRPTLHQPDGTSFVARYSVYQGRPWWRTEDGYTVIRNPQHCTGSDINSCYWEYALQGPGGMLIASGAIVTAAGNIESIPADHRPPKGLLPVPSPPEP